MCTYVRDSISFVITVFKISIYFQAVIFTRYLYSIMASLFQHHTHIRTSSALCQINGVERYIRKHIVYWYICGKTKAWKDIF